MIILLGVPGSGKSTQAELLLKRGEFRWLSMGEVFRSKATQEQREKMLKGKLINSQEAIDLLSQELNYLGDKPELVLDGFPRYTSQANWLLEQVRKGLLKITAVIFLYVDKDVVKRRMLLRGREDDSEDVISNRFDEFERTSLPAINKLEKGGIKVLKINADQNPEAISEDIAKELRSIGVSVG